MAVDLFCGLGGWTEGLLSEGYDVVGFDIERRPYAAQLVLQDVTTLDGAQFKDAQLIVASPPCTEYSYMAMPWKQGKQIARALRGEDEFPDGYKGSHTVEELNRLFNACFRIQREASEAAGRHVPMVVENVKGAQPWVGQAKASYGSFFLWGSVESIGGRIVASGRPTFGMSSIRSNRRTQGVKVRGDWFSGPTGKGSRYDYEMDRGNRSPMRQHSSRSAARKQASALIAKIPFPLAQHIARVYAS